MRDWALFVNGIFEDIMGEIASVQAVHSGLVLYLQPYMDRPIKRLENSAPSPQYPIMLYASTTTDLKSVGFTAEIVGWEDKTALDPERQREVDEVIKQYQTKEGGLYLELPNQGKRPVNLLHVLKMTKLPEAFSVDELVKLSDRRPLSVNRSRAGGYSYVSELA